MASLRAQWVRYRAESYAKWQKDTFLGDEEMDEIFRGCGGPYTRHDHTSSWCGIFATHLLRLEKGEVYWPIGGPIKIYGSNIVRIDDHHGLDEGDVAWAPNHYFIIVMPPGDSGVPLAIHGNYAHAGPVHQIFYGHYAKFPVSSIKCYWRIS